MRSNWNSLLLSDPSNIRERYQTEYNGPPQDMGGFFGTDLDADFVLSAPAYFITAF